MAIGMTMLQRAEAIYLLDGWQTSAGARAEFALAEKLGLKVIRQDRVMRPTGIDAFFGYYNEKPL